MFVLQTEYVALEVAGRRDMKAMTVSPRDCHADCAHMMLLKIGPCEYGVAETMFYMMSVAFVRSRASLPPSHMRRKQFISEWVIPVTYLHRSHGRTTTIQHHREVYRFYLANTTALILSKPCQPTQPCLYPHHPEHYSSMSSVPA
jgi:hypothetical protein